MGLTGMAYLYYKAVKDGRDIETVPKLWRAKVKAAIDAESDAD